MIGSETDYLLQHWVLRLFVYKIRQQATKKERDKIIDDVVPKSSLLTKDVLLEKVADLSILNRETENESKPSPLDPNKQSEQTSTSVNLTTPGTPFDFDGDSKADYSTWNRSVSSVPVGTWTIKNSQTGQNSSTQLGASGNQIAPADYDGDGKTDIAIWNPNNGLWTIKKSSDGSTFTRSFGQKGDAIVPADYDGDGKADVAVWRPSSGEWYITRSSDNSWYVVTFGGQQFGDVQSSVITMGMAAPILLYGGQRAALGTYIF
ncbi:MAG: VCBS repeat-containing protein [Chloracidobacterium sp.]|nr:VCBS repeat-containing protein [Chloracidobacterium sp.]